MSWKFKEWKLVSKLWKQKQNAKLRRTRACAYSFFVGNCLGEVRQVFRLFQGRWYSSFPTAGRTRNGRRGGGRERATDTCCKDDVSFIRVQVHKCTTSLYLPRSLTSGNLWIVFWFLSSLAPSAKPSAE